MKHILFDLKDCPSELLDLQQTAGFTLDEHLCAVLLNFI